MLALYENKVSGRGSGGQGYDNGRGYDSGSGHNHVRGNGFGDGGGDGMGDCSENNSSKIPWRVTC